jgi:hypothetical protein
MGPGLFLAGLIVMLAVTKKVLSMASFGLPLAVGGAGIVRSTLRSFINVAAAKALVDAASTGGKAAEEGAGEARAPTKSGPGERIRGDTPTPPSNTQGTAARGAKPKRRNLFEGAGVTSSRDEVSGQRQERRARVEEAEREEQARDANAIATGMRRGVWRSREAPRTDYELLAQRVYELRTVWGGAPTGGAQAAGEGDAAGAGTAQAREQVVWAGVPADRVREAGRTLPAGDRSGLAGAARAAVENHPADPVAAWREFRHAGTNQYAGREMSGEEREAVASVLAAPPERVWEAFRPDYERFQWRQPETGEPRTGGYDPDLFRFGRVTGGGR